MRRGSKNRSFLIFIFTFSLFFIVVNDIKDAKSVPVSSQNPILFVHGYSGDASNWNTMKLHFYYDGWSGEILRAFTFSDTWNGTSEGNIVNAKSIENWVDEFLNDTGADKVDIIAHSMGGLSSRYYLKFLNSSNKVDDFVCLGSPQHGILGGIDVFHPNSSLMFSLNEGDETPGGILNDTLGFRVDPVGSRIYNSTHIPGEINYTSIYSTGDGVVLPVITSELDGANNVQVEGVSHTSLIFDTDIYTIIKYAVYDDHSEGNNNPSIPGFNLLALLGSILLLTIFFIKNHSKSYRFC